MVNDSLKWIEETPAVNANASDFEEKKQALEKLAQPILMAASASGDATQPGGPPPQGGPGQEPVDIQEVD